MGLINPGFYFNSTPVDLLKSRRQMLLIESVRIGFLFAILLMAVFFQISESEFINLEVLLPVYIVLGCGLAAHGMYVFFFDTSLRYWAFKVFIFALDSLVITLLIYYTGVGYSIFLFLYLVNIILCGLVFQKIGAVILAAWTSILFSSLLVIEPEVKGQALYFSLVLNNLAFFAVAYLSGYLSEQLNFMGSALSEQSRGLRVLRDMHKSIVENVGSGMITVTAEGVIIHCNPEGEKILALPLSDLENESIEDVFPGVLDFIARRNWQREKSHKLDFELKNADGDHLTIEVVISAIWKGEGADLTEGYILLFQDLTKVRKLEFAMRQSEKLAAVGQLAAGIAHEIRNPLASISGSIQLLATMDGSEDEKARLMKIVLREIDRLNNMISEFLDFVRPDKPLAEEVDLNKLVNEVMDMLKVDGRLRQEVEQVRALGGPSLVSGEYGKLKQALLNILINGYQALEKSEAPKISVTTRSTGGSVVLCIQDNGCGMSEANRKKLFEPFHTTKPKGTGLGLAITHKILENHGAKVFVRSEVGVGTEFVIEFQHRAGSDGSDIGNPTGPVKTSLEPGRESPENIREEKRGSE